mmetsp:Transcript_21380/g.20527  ORF Transcript_21380/g.20527 Transcript_21380/m.20527 type:complete len:179 (+) Transcript_21380:707-1243(+)
MTENDLYAINVPFMVIGTFLTMIGWAVMTAAGTGTTHSLNSYAGRYYASNSILNCLLSGATSGLVSFMLKRHIVCGDHMKTPRYDVRSLCNGFLAGMGAVAAGAGLMRPWGGLITGFIEAFLYCLSCLVLKKIKVDDPMENFSIYCSAGVWSMVACAFFIPDHGILWGTKESGNLLGI